MHITDKQYRELAEIPHRNQVTREFCKDIFTIVEWTLVIAALSYVHQRYGSTAALLVSLVLYVVLLKYVANVVAYTTTILFRKTSFLLVAFFVGLSAITFGAGIYLLVDDVVSSNYEISAGECEQPSTAPLSIKQ